MAAKRGKTQARRSGGGGGGNGGGLPGWAWLVIGVAVTLLVVLAVPRLMHRDSDGFFRPKPNPDAQPKPANDDAVVDDETAIDAPADAKPGDAAAAKKKKQGFDFYTLLPGKEVPMSDAELAASERAEKAQQGKAKAATAVSTSDPAPAGATTTTAVEPKPLPAPVDEHAAKPVPADVHAAAPAPATATATASPDKAVATDAHYLLQAGAFQASGQAEELKARIALLGLGARVESAQIGGKTVYRVRMGPYGTAGELAEAKRKLAAGGLSAMAVRTH
ncbi:SPOR domain-containing protein [Cognatilysobacter lacus]|uniref:Sporulation protein n=1 Tax=Cognatilysobacter lacus TaxID=1643323 RepID=A0A5D8Z5N8_9GAMM|nr:SPOR domain-containing protein [Lysobacter lacus]TZF89960.1 sporulation protein [Lysobacter lacus]